VSRASIKAVFFDFDGVLTTDKSGSLTTIRSISRQTSIPEAALWEAFAPFNHDLLVGRKTHASVWPHVCNALGEAVPLDVLEVAFLDTPMNRPMLDLAREFHERYRIGIITDNKSDRMDCLCARHRLRPMFDPVLVSAAIGSGKDQPEIFRYALDLLGLAPEETVFIDNSEKNLVAPSSLGMGTIFYDDEKNDVAGLRAAIDRMGVDSRRVR
jgi:putative hydrolase of the HAD superfamily